MQLKKNQICKEAGKCDSIPREKSVYRRGPGNNRDDNNT